MKLLHRSYLQAAYWIIPILILGGLFSFYAIRYIIYEETDEYLQYEMERLIEYHRTWNDLPDYHQVTNIIPEKETPEPFFKDTLILEEADDEMVPHRELHFSLLHNGEYTTLVLRQILPGNDDLLEGVVFIMIGLMVLFILVLLLIVRQLSRNLWQPFYHSLHELERFKINDELPILHDTQVEEFKSLNASVLRMMKKMQSDFHRTKEFHENASHELQTYLAVIRANAEELLSLDRPFEEGDKAKLKVIYDAGRNLTQVHKGLMLLSKIGNEEFQTQIPVNLDKQIQESLRLFDEAIQLKGIHLRYQGTTKTLLLDEGLIETLLSNLIKNAVKYNEPNGFIQIELTPETLIIENSGKSIIQQPEQLKKRFIRGKNGNTGIGLAIVSQICELYQFDFQYEVIGNLHRVHIRF